MRRGLSLSVALVAGLVIGCGAMRAHAGGPPAEGQAQKEKSPPPPVFSDMAFADAVARSKDGKAITVVKFTAEWCGPCKEMDRTSWRDPRLEAWFKDKGVAIQVDVEKERKVSQDNHIRAMPTMVAFVKGEAFDRVVGFQNADQLLAWLGRVEKGESASAVLDRQLKDADQLTMSERMTLARDLVENGRFDEATRELLWLWNNMVKKEPAMVGVRVSFLTMQIGELARQHAPALKAFASERDQIEARLKGDERSWDDLSDWLALNDALEQTDKTLAWFDRIKNDPESKATISRMTYRIRPVLEANQRWEDLGRMLDKPAEGLQSQIDLRKRFKPRGNVPREVAEVMRRSEERTIIGEAGTTYASLLLAGRVDDAKKVVSVMAGAADDPSARAVVVQRALEIGAAHPDLLRVLDEGKPAPESQGEWAELRRQVKEALAKKGA